MKMYKLLKTTVLLFLVAGIAGQVFAGGRRSTGTAEEKSLTWLSQGPGEGQ
jgi:hypothetical protein